MKFIFWLSFIGAIYSYFVYPIILLLLPKRPKQAHVQENFLPAVTVIITAHNEQAKIKDKILNTLSLDYPKALVEILVASDASTDKTNQIVLGMKAQGVRLVKVDERKGKEFAQLQAINEAKGEILIFSDVATELKNNALNLLVDKFKDPRVGAISSEDRFLSKDGSVIGEGIYVKYEMWLRKLESKVHSLVGLSGSFFAARKTVCDQWDFTVPSDFNTALNCVRKGLVASSDPQIVGYYKNIKQDKGEYIRKYRTVVRGISAIAKKPDILNPINFGFFSFQVWSHKIMRWLVPWFLILLLIASFAMLNKHWGYTFVLILQVVFYCLVILGVTSETLRRKSFIRIPYYFIQVNIAIAHALLAFLLGKRITIWEPTKR